ncbi:myelin-associated glycoprotein-like [Trichomycterus rosablanca]|uniref:myelin-associated glycoprotein-like n=1 Tax=Trichomycterus rosablanca TaxID=2290929 RepID=UPI002F35AB9D
MEVQSFVYSEKSSGETLVDIKANSAAFFLAGKLRVAVRSVEMKAVQVERAVRDGIERRFVMWMLGSGVRSPRCRSLTSAPARFPRLRIRLRLLRSAAAPLTKMSKKLFELVGEKWKEVCGWVNVLNHQFIPGTEEVKTLEVLVILLVFPKQNSSPHCPLKRGGKADARVSLRKKGTRFRPKKKAPTRHSGLQQGRAKAIGPEKITRGQLTRLNPQSAVLCREFSIDLPEKVEALNGSCVLLPCTFQIRKEFDSDLQNDPTGIWKKSSFLHVTNDVWNENRYTEVFNSKQSEQNQIKGKITGDLKQKNCTTIFYNIQESNTGNYMFKLETPGALKWNFKERTVSINVRSNVTSPSVTLYKKNQMEEQKEVLEGTSVSLVCSAPSSCPSNLPNFTWSFLPEEKILNQNTSFSSSTLNFRASHLHHGLNITCTITYQLENKNIRSAQSSFTLRVLYASKNTRLKVSPSAPVFLGSSVNLSCSSDANPAVLNFTWYRRNGEQIGTGNHLIINKTDETHHGLYCRAQNQHGDQNSSIYLDLQYAPKNTTLKVSPPALVLLGSSVILSCSSYANPAVLNFTWYRRNGEQLRTGNHLNINQTDEIHHGLYCRAQNQHGDQNSSIYLDLLYAPQISFSSRCNTDHTSIQCFCVVHGYPSPKLEWHLSDQTLLNESTIQESVSNVTLNSSISIHLPQTKATPILQCVGTNHLGVATQIFSFIDGAQVPDSSAG